MRLRCEKTGFRKYSNLFNCALLMIFSWKMNALFFLTLGMQPGERHIYERGCLRAGEEWIESNLVPVAAVKVGVMVLQVFGHLSFSLFIFPFFFRPLFACFSYRCARSVSARIYNFYLCIELRRIENNKRTWMSGGGRGLDWKKYDFYCFLYFYYFIFSSKCCFVDVYCLLFWLRRPLKLIAFFSSNRFWAYVLRRIYVPTYSHKRPNGIDNQELPLPCSTTFYRTASRGSPPLTNNSNLFKTLVFNVWWDYCE